MTPIKFPRAPTLIAVAMTVLCLLPATSSAQLNGTNLKGDACLKAGSQAPPGAYVGVPLSLYTASRAWACRCVPAKGWQLPSV